MQLHACLKLWLKIYGHENVSDQKLAGDNPGGYIGMGSPGSHPGQASVAAMERPVIPTTSR